MRFNTDTVTGTCGVGCIYDYGSYYANYDFNTVGEFEGGTGFNIAGFVDRESCKQTFLELIERCPVVYQSPVRNNSNTGNEFFFVLFDEELSNDTTYTTAKWPW